MTSSIDITEDEELDEPEVYELAECHCCERCGHGQYCDLDEMAFVCDKYEEEDE